MSRRIALVVFVVACKGAATRPDPAAFEKLSSDQQCEAVAPRTESCHDELIAADLRKLGMSGSDVDHIYKEMKADDALSSEKARGLNANACRAELQFARAVFECWEQPDCTALAGCVSSKTSSAKPAKP